jgi:hypothetical protein
MSPAKCSSRQTPLWVKGHESRLTLCISTTPIAQGAAVAITTTVVLMVLATVCTAVMVALVVAVVETEAYAVTVETAGEALPIKQLHAKLMRGGR